MFDNFKFGVTVAVEDVLGAPFPIIYPDIYHTIRWLGKNGFDGVELHLRTPALVDASAVKACCEENGIAVSSIGTGQATGAEGLTLSAESKEIRRHTIQRLKDQVDLAAITGGVVIVGSMRGNIGKERTFADHDRVVVEAMREVSDHAGPKEVELVFEAIDRYETDYLYTADDVLGLIDRIDRKNVKLHLDTYHMNMEETDMYEPVLRAGARLGHVHAADNNRNYPGWGHIPFTPFLKALKRISYQGFIVIESYSEPDGYTACLRGLDHLKRCLAEGM